MVSSVWLLNTISGFYQFFFNYSNLFMVSVTFSEQRFSYFWNTVAESAAAELCFAVRSGPPIGLGSFLG